jgi:hypothetical protein
MTRTIFILALGGSLWIVLLAGCLGKETGGEKMAPPDAIKTTEKDAPKKNTEMIGKPNVFSLKELHG